MCKIEHFSLFKGQTNNWLFQRFFRVQFVYCGHCSVLIAKFHVFSNYNEKTKKFVSSVPRGYLTKFTFKTVSIFLKELFLYRLKTSITHPDEFQVPNIQLDRVLRGNRAFFFCDLVSSIIWSLLVVSRIFCSNIIWNHGWFHETR